MREMDFARSQLTKYGWKEGEGLGRKKDGLSAPVKTVLKLNSHGVGYNAGQEFGNNWWERVFNEAAANVQAVEQKGGAVTQVVTSGEIEISVKKKPKGYRDLTYGAFEKKSCLNGQTIENVESSGSSTEEDESSGRTTDEQLFKLCGGRTGHKGARHGLKLGGKLARLEQQEKRLVTAQPSQSVSTKRKAEKTTTKKKKKECKKRQKESKEDDVSGDEQVSG